MPENLKKFLIKASLLFILSDLCVCLSAQQGKIDFYGIHSDDADRNMINMTEDLYMTQLKEMNLRVTDRRSVSNIKTVENTDNIDFSFSDPDSKVLYAVISRKGDALSEWQSTIYIRNLTTGKTALFSKDYDSFYKILMESKPVLNQIFTSLLNSLDQDKTQMRVSESQIKSQERIPSPPQAPPVINHNTQNSTEIKTEENFTGSWSGEEAINKIVIMHGGRGFIILKNGASMNITVSMDEKQGTITVTQAGHSNASYFPELSREDAVEVSKYGKQIRWVLSMDSDYNLSGNKFTFYKDNSGIISEKMIPVTWKKIN